MNSAQKKALISFRVSSERRFYGKFSPPECAGLFTRGCQSAPSACFFALHPTWTRFGTATVDDDDDLSALDAEAPSAKSP